MTLDTTPVKLDQETCHHQVSVNPNIPMGAVQCVKCKLIIPAIVVRAIEDWIESHKHDCY